MKRIQFLLVFDSYLRKNDIAFNKKSPQYIEKMDLSIVSY